MSATAEDMLEALKKRLGISGDDEDELLAAYIEDAADEVQIYLGWPDSEWEERPATLDRKIVQLTVILYRQEQSEQTASGIASMSTSEESLSQSVSYKGSTDWKSQREQVLCGLARFRRVAVHGADAVRSLAAGARRGSCSGGA